MKLEIQSQEHTDIYGLFGYICIKQKDPSGKDAIVMFAVQSVDMVCQMLQEAKKGSIKNRSIYLESKGEE